MQTILAKAPAPHLDIPRMGVGDAVLAGLLQSIAETEEDALAERAKQAGEGLASPHIPIAGLAVHAAGSAGRVTLADVTAAVASADTYRLEARDLEQFANAAASAPDAGGAAGAGAGGGGRGGGRGTKMEEEGAPAWTPLFRVKLHKPT
ncbi:MAG: hypothetical protein ACK41Y_16915, partial [Paracoccus hibiscisoli]|uniref:hypothetical protein n=1 Tax=Paracoccus hibiscisoli TaxID=2023261 RepID=UPI00391D856B